MIAGGIGIAPSMSVLRSMADENDPRPVTLFYGHRVLEHVEFAQELAELEEKLPNFKKVLVLEKPHEDWEGYRGYITQEVLQNELPGDNHNLHYFVCGPPAHDDCHKELLNNMHIPQENVHYEEFNMA